MEREPLDTDFEEEKPAASVAQQREPARKLTRKSVAKSTVSQAATGRATEDKEIKKEGVLLDYAARTRETLARVTWRD